MLTEGNETVWLLATEGILKLQLLCVFWPGCQFTSHRLVTGVDIFTVHHICFFQVCINSLQDSLIILFPDKLSKPLHGIGVQEDVLFSNTVHTKQQHIIFIPTTAVISSPYHLRDNAFYRELVNKCLNSLC